MNLSNQTKRTRNQGGASAFTLVEVVTAMVISVLVFSTILLAYVQAARFAEWSGYSLAAQALSIQQLEQARSAVWDTQRTPPLDEVTNLNLTAWQYSSDTRTWSGYTNAVLDIPAAQNKEVLATNFISVQTVSLPSNPQAAVRFIKVSTVWSFQGKTYTNSIATYFAPDRYRGL
jgi:type II secretory pathway pseudopilin PulG